MLCETAGGLEHGNSMEIQVGETLVGAAAIFSVAGMLVFTSLGGLKALMLFR